MTVSFNAIPINIRTPGHYIEFDSSRAVQGLPAITHKILVMGQRLSAGTVAQAIPKKILSAAQGENYFGRGSQLSHMLAALKKANSYTEVWAIALDDNGAGTAATGTITVTGPATESGTINVYLGGERIQVAVTSGDSANVVAAAINTAIGLRTDLSVTAAVSTNVVTLTARHKGLCGNSIDVRIGYYTDDVTPKGLALAVVAMSGGASNPSASTAITAIGDEQYHTIITPWTDSTNLTAIETLLSSRWGPLVQKEGQAFAGVSGSQSTMTTLGAARNSPHLTLMGSGKSPTPPWIWAAVAGAVDAFEPDPARPRQTLVLTGLLAPVQQDRLTRDERNLCLFDGVSTYLVDAGGQVLIERLITTYQTNAYGVDDTAYLDIETMRTLAFLRFSVRSRIALKFPRHKLAADGTRFGPGQAVVTPSIIRNELLALFLQWEEAGLAEGYDQFATDLIVERSSSDPNRVDAVIPPDVINQFRVFAGQIQFRL